MTKRLRLRAGFLGLALSAIAAGGVRGAEEASASRWISSDAVIFVELSQPVALIDRVTDPRLQKLLDVVPGYKAAFERDEALELRKGVSQVAEELGTTWDKALRDLTGRGVIAAVEAEKGKAPRAFVVVTPREDSILEKAMKVVLDLAREKGPPDLVKDAEYRGVTGHQVGPKLTFAVVRGRLVIADNGETLKAVIDRALDGLPSGRSIEDQDLWKARKAAVPSGAIAWGLARIDRLRELDPKKFTIGEKHDPGQTLLFGGWLETARKASWASVTVSWTEERLAAELALPAEPGNREGAFKGYLPPAGAGAPRTANLPGTALELGLWRDLAALWEARADLFRPEDVQNLAKLDTFAGQFFGGRDFGTGVLGAIGTDWRLVAALQDYPAMKPTPDVKLPAFALVIDLKPDDDDFAQRLKVAFQSFIGLANLGAAQTKAPPLELGSETFEGVTIATARFMPPKVEDAKDKDAEPVHYRQNFSPSAVQVGNHFVISSSVGLARDLVKSLRAPALAPHPATLAAEADGVALARLVDLNRTQLVMRNMLDKGHDKERAEGEIDLLAALLRYLGRGRLSIQDGMESMRVGVEFALGK